MANIARHLASPAVRRELRARVVAFMRSQGADPSNDKRLDPEGDGTGNQAVSLQKAALGHDAVLEPDSADVGSEAAVETYREMQLDEL
ncbi:hypothetical protein FRC09_014065, partial [Ceratobasidium sp. 395]